MQVQNGKKNSFKNIAKTQHHRAILTHALTDVAGYI